NNTSRRAKTYEKAWDNVLVVGGACLESRGAAWWQWWPSSNSGTRLSYNRSPVCVALQLEESGVGAVVGGVGVKAAALFLARERHINPQYLEWAVQRGRGRGRGEEEDEEEEDCSQLFPGCGEEKND
ncbi:hypothetical protein Pcinc_034903, partial [Petrolisthes cinctipes]